MWEIAWRRLNGGQRLWELPRHCAKTCRLLLGLMPRQASKVPSDTFESLNVLLLYISFGMDVGAQMITQVPRMSDGIGIGIGIESGECSKI